MIKNLNTLVLHLKIDYNPKGSFCVLSNSDKIRFVFQYVIRVILYAYNKSSFVLVVKIASSA